jgi:hypothetical protein
MAAQGLQAPARAHEIGERLELSREEVGSLSGVKVGVAILVLPTQQHLPLRVIVPPRGCRPSR